jgi:hypothetical protein
VIRWIAYGGYIRGCEQRGAQRDRGLRVGINGDGAAQLSGDELRDQRHPGGTADQQHHVQFLRFELGGLQGAPQRLHSLADLGANHVFKLGANQPHLGLDPGGEDRDRHHGICGQRLFGINALSPQRCSGGQYAGVLGIQPGQSRNRGEYMAEHRVVKVDPA